MAKTGPARRSVEPAARAGTPRNEVCLVGRVAAHASERILPSGDALVGWRLVVDRAAATRTHGETGRATVDTLDCVAFLAGPRRTGLRLAPGDVVQVEGALRRRFWRSPTGAASRCEVEVASVRRISRAPTP